MWKVYTLAIGLGEECIVTRWMVDQWLQMCGTEYRWVEVIVLVSKWYGLVHFKKRQLINSE